MKNLKRLPIGVEDFTEIQKRNFYFVDKTAFISELLQNPAKVCLFTRPRRFGKSLNLSMLKAFLEIDCDKTLFDGLVITKETELCKEHMGQYPVIFLSLKGIEGNSYEMALDLLRKLIFWEVNRFNFLSASPKLTEKEKESYNNLLCYNNDHPISTANVVSSLLTLSRLLEKHFEKKVVILIDEYDVPLDKANQNGYYDQMISLIRGLFHNALKSNSSLQFAVLTGCLRVSKESIFTGMNNLTAVSITHERFQKHFGFTTTEVAALLDYYKLSDAQSIIKEWYDGYLFGNEAIYCPWDVMNYCYELLALREKSPLAILRPKNYWINTSGNYIIKSLLKKANQQTKLELEVLVEGGVLEKKIEENLIYAELNQDIEHLWSVLFSTGYLTCIGITEEGKYQLKIPNLEIRSIFVDQIMEWFKDIVKAEPSRLETLCTAVESGSPEIVQQSLTDYLKRTIHIRDTFVRKAKKENFYHGILLGLLEYRENWIIKSNAEAGDGYCDIRIQDVSNDLGIIIEVKYAENAKFDEQCQEVLDQIERDNYAQELYDDGVTKILKYGIAFYKKRCKVVLKSS